MFDVSTDGAAVPRTSPALMVEIVCIKSSWCAGAGFEAQLAAAAAGLPGVCLAWAPPARARAVLPPGVLADGSTPAVVIKVGGRVMAHALGTLPRWELRSLIETALRNAR